MTFRAVSDIASLIQLGFRLMEIIKLDMPQCGGMGRNAMWKTTD